MYRAQAPPTAAHVVQEVALAATKVIHVLVHPGGPEQVALCALQVIT